MRIPIDIAVPIWKTRSVGINPQMAGPNDEFVINITYVNKQGNRIYPHEYIVTAQWLVAYPIQKLEKSKVVLHIIPISDLENLYHQQNVTNKQINMLFDSNEINKIRKENEERSGFDKRERIPMGANTLTITDVKADISKKSKEPMIVMTFKKDDAHKEIVQYFMLAGKGSDIAKSKMIDWLERAFNYIIQPCETEQDLVNQLIKFKGLKVQACIQHEKSLYTNKEGEVMIVREAKVWYVDSINTNMKVDLKKCLRELAPKDIERVNQLNEMGKTVHEADSVKDNETDASPTADNTDGIVMDVKGDGLPF